jgi:Salmonella virulence plasmid 65kDa B protein/FG-GAP-like repeat
MRLNSMSNPRVAKEEPRPTRSRAAHIGRALIGGWALMAAVSVDAQIAVSESGTASYSIPIAVPPGIAGMVPNIGLSYNGSGVNGPVGYGWSIQGISMIARCPQTRVIDGFVRSVSFSSDDKLCLDGQRLIQTDANGVVTNGSVSNPGLTNLFQSGDSLGGAGTAAMHEYRTEKDSYARIRAYGSAGGVAANGPAYFKVWTKSGQVYEYGNSGNASANAAINAQGKTVIAAWPVSRIGDTLGNYIDFQYQQRDVAWGSGPNASSPTPGHEWNLTEIRYTGNATQAPANKVVFSYDDRSAPGSGGPVQDRSESYQTGSKNVSIYRLNAIRTYVNVTGAPVKAKTYKLSYDAGSIATRSRIVAIQECAGTAETACQPATRFNYSNGGADTFQPNPQFAASPLAMRQLQSAAKTYGTLVGDFDGDGKSDLLVWSDNPSSNELHFSNGDGTFRRAANFNITDQNLFKSGNSTCGSIIADFNGDGLVDLFRYGGAFCTDPSTNYLYLNNSDGSFTRKTITLSDGFNPIRQSSYDQGRCQSNSGSGCGFLKGWSQGWNFYVLDVNGDGRLDLVVAELPAQPAGQATNGCVSGCTRVYLGDGQGNFSAVATNLSGQIVYQDPRSERSLSDVRGGPADVDGDGLMDLVSMFNSSPLYSGAALTWRSRGDGNFDAITSAPFCDRAIDFNGDGRADCLVLPVPSSTPVSTTGPNTLLVADGSGATPQVANFNLAAPGLLVDYTTGQTGVTIIDLNADGRGDLLRWRDDPAQTTVYYSNGDGSFTASTGFNLNTPARQLKKSDGTRDFAIGDFTGRGSVEFLRLVDSPTPGEGTTNQLYEKVDKTPPDQLLSVVSPTGLTTTLTWVPLSNSASGSLGARYTSDRGVAGKAASLPKIDVTLPSYVVATSASDSGAGTGPLTTEYSYAGLKAAYDGRGTLGFRETRRQSDASSNSILTVVTQYLQDHPYVGAASATQTYDSGLALLNRQLSATTSIYCDKTAAAGAETTATPTAPCLTSRKVQKPYLFKTFEQGWDPTSLAALPTVTTTNAFDASGNPTNIAIQTEGDALGVHQVFTKTTTNTYLPDATSGDSWILGRLQQATQRNTAPNSLGSIPTSFGSAPNASAIQGNGPTSFAGLSSVSFGGLTVGATSTLTSTLTNIGAFPLGVTVPTAASVSGGGFSFAATTCASTLVPNASCTINVVLAPTAVGSYAGTLSVATGAGTKTANLSGNGIAPSVVFQPASTNWGTIGAASDSGDWPTIKNNSSVPVLIVAHAPLSGPTGMWSWQGGTPGNWCIPGTTVLTPGASCQTFFGISNLASVGGPYTAVDQISYQAQGVTGATFTAQQSYTFSVATTTANSGGFNFGTVIVNKTTFGQAFTLTNNALNGGSVKNLSINMVGSQPGNFPMTHNCGTALAAGASCTVTVSFNPTWAANGFSASVQVRGGYSRIQAGVDSGYTPLTGVSIVVPVSGNGGTPTLPNIVANPAAVSASSTAPDSASTSVSFSNTGQTATILQLSVNGGNWVVPQAVSCPAEGSCGAVTVTSPPSGGFYNGALTMTSSAGGTVTSVPVNLSVLSDTMPWENGGTSFSICGGQFAGSLYRTASFSINGGSEAVTISPSVGGIYTVSTVGWTNGTVLGAGTYQISIGMGQSRGDSPISITFAGTGHTRTTNVHVYEKMTCP